MGRKAQISLVAVVFTAIVVALLAYVWDSTRDNRIAEGVTIGGVDVGGLDAANAKRQVQTSLLDPLNETVTVKYDGEKFTLTPHESDLSADIDRTIDEAVAVSREGGLPTRTWRALTGGEVNEEITPKISYDQDAVDHFVAHIAGNIDRDAVDASVEPSGGKLVPVSSKSGRKIDEDALRNDVVKALEDPAQRTVKADVEKVKPEVTTSEVADKYPTYIVVDRSNFTLTLYKDLEAREAVHGRDRRRRLRYADRPLLHPGQAGRSRLERARLRLGRRSRRADDPAGPRQPVEGALDGHLRRRRHPRHSDTGSLGSAASHGCVRMSVPDVIDLYDRVDVGTPIYIG